jgi:hypothetical protein
LLATLTSRRYPQLSVIHQGEHASAGADKSSPGKAVAHMPINKSLADHGQQEGKAMKIDITASADRHRGDSQPSGSEHGSRYWRLRRALEIVKFIVWVVFFTIGTAIKIVWEVIQHL